MLTRLFSTPWRKETNETGKFSQQKSLRLWVPFKYGTEEDILSIPPPSSASSSKTLGLVFRRGEIFSWKRKLYTLFAFVARKLAKLQKMDFPSTTKNFPDRKIFLSRRISNISVLKNILSHRWGCKLPSEVIRETAKSRR